MSLNSPLQFANWGPDKINSFMQQWAGMSSDRRAGYETAYNRWNQEEPNKNNVPGYSWPDWFKALFEDPADATDPSGKGTRWEGFENKQAWRDAGKPWPGDDMGLDDMDGFSTLYMGLRNRTPFNPNPNHIANVPFGGGSLSGHPAPPPIMSSSSGGGMLAQPYDPSRSPSGPIGRK